MKKFIFLCLLTLFIIACIGCNTSNTADTETLTDTETDTKPVETSAETAEAQTDPCDTEAETICDTTAEEVNSMVERTIDQRYFIYRIWNFFKNTQAQFESTADAAEAAGFNAIKVHIPWSWVEQTDGIYNFDDFDAMIDYVVNTKKMGVAISLDLTRTQGDTVIPESEIMVSNGGGIYVGGVGGNRMQISFASEHAMSKATEFFKTAVEHYESLFGSSNKILFYLPAFSLYCETEYFCVNENDYSSDAIGGFRLYLKDKYSTVEALNDALKLDYASFEEVTAPDTSNTKPIGIEWYTYRHNTLKNAIDRLANAQKSTASNSKFAIQLGCVYDDLAKKRGTFDFADLCEKVDVLWCDDGPTMNHQFSMSYVWSALPASVELAQEIDGPSQVGASPENYLKQGLECFACGCKYVSIANWSIDSTFDTYKPVWREISDTWLTRATPETMTWYGVLYPNAETDDLEIPLSKVFKSGIASYHSKFESKLKKSVVPIIKIKNDLTE